MSVAFSPEYRNGLRDELIAAAWADSHILGAAITGSASVGREDRWSDIDLYFGVDTPLLERTLADWTDRMYSRHDVVHHLDVKSGATVYRVFLLRNTLQVDLAFAPPAEFAARGATFRLVFGDPVEIPAPAPLGVEHLVGYGWLYALHARACIQRAQWWRAEYMVRGIRDTALTLACLRSGLPLSQGRGFDSLPPEVTAPLREALVGELNAETLARAFGAAAQALLVETRAADVSLCTRLEEVVGDLVRTATVDR